jgi:hypothetical protein
MKKIFNPQGKTPQNIAILASGDTPKSELLKIN